MGEMIILRISTSTTQAEWEPVYEEALDLAQRLRLAELRKVEIGGLAVTCLMPVEERSRPFRLWNVMRIFTSFVVDGDYLTLQSCEDNRLPRYLIDELSHLPDVDAMLSVYADGDMKLKRTAFELFGGETEGLSHHIPLLAIACLIQDRLGRKAYVGGDITADQCRRAVVLANKHLERPISMPDRCDRERLTARVQKLPVSPERKAELIDLAGLFQNMDQAIQETAEKGTGLYAQYDIVQHTDLLDYQNGDRIEPELLEKLRGFFASYRAWEKEETDKIQELIESGAQACFAYLADALRVWLRDRDWQTIYAALQTDAMAFARYYPACRVRISGEAEKGAVRAILINDELYAFLLQDHEAAAQDQ